MDYLQGLDQKLLSAMSLIRPVSAVPPVTVPPQKIWTDCVDFPNPQNPCKKFRFLSIEFHPGADCGADSLGFFAAGVYFIELGYTIGKTGAIIEYVELSGMAEGIFGG